ncbi:hypothetical protein [Halobacteriovorax sp. CON-3]|uniref:hypothetical protein n=1 Tax=Halobacteriovorax sp. CON-3 TaxID=3157710 RepID=UPI00370FBF3B
MKKIAIHFLVVFSLCTYAGPGGGGGTGTALPDAKVVFGKHIFNIKDISDVLTQNHDIVEVRDLLKKEIITLKNNKAVPCLSCIKNIQLIDGRIIKKK